VVRRRSQEGLKTPVAAWVYRERRETRSWGIKNKGRDVAKRKLHLRTVNKNAGAGPERGRQGSKNDAVTVERSRHSMREGVVQRSQNGGWACGKAHGNKIGANKGRGGDSPKRKTKKSMGQQDQSERNPHQSAELYGRQKDQSWENALRGRGWANYRLMV